MTHRNRRRPRPLGFSLSLSLWLIGSTRACLYISVHKHLSYYTLNCIIYTYTSLLQTLSIVWPLSLFRSTSNPCVHPTLSLNSIVSIVVLPWKSVRRRGLLSTLCDLYMYVSSKGYVLLAFVLWSLCTRIIYNYIFNALPVSLAFYIYICYPCVWSQENTIWSVEPLYWEGMLYSCIYIHCRLLMGIKRDIMV